jgi:tetratricopeptide (TPR) repeat protein
MLLIWFLAAIQLKNASEYKRAIEVYLKVAAMNESRRSYFNAGKALDSASGCCRDLEDLDGVLAYADQGLPAFHISYYIKISSFLAADLFRSNGQPDTAYHTLIRAAKHAEPKRPEASIEFYQKAANMYRMEGGRVREAADVLNRVACLQFWDFDNFDNIEEHIDIFTAQN